jgi:hypothetical protein
MHSFLKKGLVMDAPEVPGLDGPALLEAFCEDARALLRADRPDLQALRARFEGLLRMPAFVAHFCGPQVAPGLYRIYRDEALGFQVLAHLNQEARVSPPHDHGASWAIYGQAVGYTDMTEWDRPEAAAEDDRAELVPRRRYRLEPGQAGVYASGAIHSIDYPAGSRFVRITGTDLDAISRRSFDAKTGAVTRMGPTQSS